MPSSNDIPLPENALNVRLQLSREDADHLRMLGARGGGYSLAAVCRTALSLLVARKLVAIEEIIPELDILAAQAAAPPRPPKVPGKPGRPKKARKEG